VENNKHVGGDARERGYNGKRKRRTADQS